MLLVRLTAIFFPARSAGDLMPDDGSASIANVSGGQLTP
jgi:hypothetical protein